MRLAAIKAQGYTLIEILVVLFIVSIVASVALLTISHNENKQLQMFANDLAQTVVLAKEQAMLEPTVLGVRFTDDSFNFLNYDPAAADKKNIWHLRQDTILGKREIPKNIELSVEIKQEKNLTENIPQVIISTNGDLTPFKIFVGKKGKKPRYVIIGQADGSITNQELS